MIPEGRCGLSPNTQKKIVEIILKNHNVRRILLYGSRATGAFKSGSDIDLTLDAPAMDIRQLLKIENDLDDLLLVYKIDLSLLHHIDNVSLLNHIQRFAIELTD